MNVHCPLDVGRLLSPDLSHQLSCAVPRAGPTTFGARGKLHSWSSLPIFLHLDINVASHQKLKKDRLYSISSSNVDRLGLGLGLGLEITHFKNYSKNYKVHKKTTQLQ